MRRTHLLLAVATVVLLATVLGIGATASEASAINASSVSSTAKASGRRPKNQGSAAPQTPAPERKACFPIDAGLPKGAAVFWLMLDDGPLQPVIWAPTKQPATRRHNNDPPALPVNLEMLKPGTGLARILKRIRQEFDIREGANLAAFRLLLPDGHKLTVAAASEKNATHTERLIHRFLTDLVLDPQNTVYTGASEFETCDLRGRHCVRLLGTYPNLKRFFALFTYEPDKASRQAGKRAKRKYLNELDAAAEQAATAVTATEQATCFAPQKNAQHDRHSEHQRQQPRRGGSTPTSPSSPNSASSSTLTTATRIRAAPARPLEVPLPQAPRRSPSGPSITPAPHEPPKPDHPKRPQPERAPSRPATHPVLPGTPTAPPLILPLSPTTPPITPPPPSTPAALPPNPATQPEPLPTQPEPVPTKSAPGTKPLEKPQPPGKPTSPQPARELPTITPTEVKPTAPKELRPPSPSKQPQPSRELPTITPTEVKPSAPKELPTLPPSKPKPRVTRPTRPVTEPISVPPATLPTPQVLHHHANPANTPASGDNTPTAAAGGRQGQEQSSVEGSPAEVSVPAQGSPPRIEQMERTDSSEDNDDTEEQPVEDPPSGGGDIAPAPVGAAIGAGGAAPEDGLCAALTGGHRVTTAACDPVSKLKGPVVRHEASIL